MRLGCFGGEDVTYTLERKKCRFLRRVIRLRFTERVSLNLLQCPMEVILPLRVSKKKKTDLAPERMDPASVSHVPKAGDPWCVSNKDNRSKSAAYATGSRTYGSSRWCLGYRKTEVA